MRIGSLFSGYEGLGRAVQSVLGGDIAWVSDIDPGACKILAHRYPDVPNIGDITAVDWSAVEPVDVLTGGFPCQDLSAAGRRKGMRPGTRSGLWADFKTAIDELRPPLVVIENVRGLLSGCAETDAGVCEACAADDAANGDMELDEGRVGDGKHRPVLRALGRVLGDLAGVGFDADWIGLRASDVGAPHQRFRVFVVAWPAESESNGLQVGLRQRGGSPTRIEGAGNPRRNGGHPLSHPSDDGCERAGGTRKRGARSADSRASAADTPGHPGRLDDGDGAVALAAWGPYGGAIRRWERLTRPAPSPWQPGPSGAPQLSPAFSEWLMGLPAGWVTDVPSLTRNEQLKALGNGVVPQQAAQALRMLLPDVRMAAA